MKHLVVGGDTQLGKLYIEELSRHGWLYVECSGEDFRDNPESVALVESSDVIVSFIGSRVSSFFINKQLIDLAEKFNKKFLLLTSLGCGDSWQLLSSKGKELFGEKIRIKGLSEAWLQTSILNWKIVRPTGLTNDLLNGTLVSTTNADNAKGFVNRMGVAQKLTKIVDSVWSENEIIYIYTSK